MVKAFLLKCLDVGLQILILLSSGLQIRKSMYVWPSAHTYMFEKMEFVDGGKSRQSTNFAVADL